MSYTLEMLYKLLSPIGAQEGASTLGVNSPTLQEKIQNLIMDPRGAIHTYSYIHEQIKNEFTKSKNEKPKTEFHIFGPAQPGKVDFGDADYYDYEVSDSKGKNVKKLSVASVQDVIVNGEEEDSNSKDFVASAFVINNPYVSPSTRGVEAISYFLCHTPGIVASQMVPCLNVEFELIRPFSGDEKTVNISTPTMMRFLLGSSIEKKTMSPIDYSIEKSGIFESKDKEGKYVATSYSGLEMFLAPQTLSNMDSDGVYNVGRGRLLPQKPFTPFASIEGLDVSASNAGAGKFAHRTATLKLKIHDKARLSEMADFLRPQGYHRAIIWTTYGWLAPTDRDQEDEYCKFINDNMLVKECWSVTNTSFSFDAAGQVSLSLSLMSRGARAIQGMHVTGASKSIANQVKRFDENVKIVGEFLRKNSNNPRFALGALATQVLNQGASTGIFTDINSVGLAKAMEDITKNAQAAAVTSADMENLRKALNQLEQGAYSYESIAKHIRQSVAKRLDSFGNKDIPDPFLPTDKKAKDGYVGFDVVRTIDEFSKTIEQRKKELAALRKKAKGDKEKLKKLESIVDIDAPASVVSFGKLFLSFIAPEVKASGQCEELQVFFYTLNDQCGPVSNHNIAEFPIDVQTFAYAYAEAIKATRSDHLTVETFLKLLIETQFADQRAIGYGMYRFFKPFDVDKPYTAEQVDSKDKTGKQKKGPTEAEVAEAGLNAWFRTYGSFRVPMIEMVVETGAVTMIDGKEVSTNISAASMSQSAMTDRVAATSPRPFGKKIIKRIHIYDKQNNPHKLLQSIISAGGDKFEIGEIDKGKIDAEASTLVKGLNETQKEKLRKQLVEGANFFKALEAAGVPKDAAAKFDVVKRPGKDVPEAQDINTKNVKDQLAKMYPTITVGTNGTLITTVNASSKSDGLQGTINIQRSASGFSSGKPTVSADGLQDSNGLPMTIVPMSLSMTSVGVPTLQLYQSFYIDLGTGTNIDNVYICNTITHNISPGKFMTNMSFIYTGAYPKFSNAPSTNAIASGQMLHYLDEDAKQQQEKKKKQQGGSKK